jgi:hypothetical protein
MSRRLDDFMDALYQETMVYMADNFFGARKAIDEATEVLQEAASELHGKREKALERARPLFALLLDGEVAQDLFAALDADPCGLADEVEPARSGLPFKKPFALTRKGRYVKTLYKAYHAFQQACESYMHGDVVRDREGRKRRTNNYETVSKRCCEVNQRIDEVNDQHRPSCVLTTVRGMDVEQTEKERITEASLENWACVLDRDMELQFVNCDVLGLRPLPDLPPFVQARPVLKAFGGRLWSEHQDRLSAILDRLRDSGQD